jgi:hypothetical protein
MSKVSLGAAAEQTKSFMRREGGLVLPVAFATFGLALILIALVTPEPAAGGKVEPGLWSLAIIPLMFLAMIGQLSISYLVLRPGGSVRDALAGAVARLPTALAVILLLVAAIAAAGLLLILVMGLAAVAMGATPEMAAALGATAAIIVLLFLGARLLMAWPLIADRRSGPVSTLKEAFALSKGRVWKFLALTFAFGLVYVTFTGAAQLGLGSLLLIFGKLLGAEGAAAFLTAVAVALLGAAIQAVWAVLLANIYRQLTAPVGQTRPS